MNPQEVTEKLQLSQLKDRVWYVVPSCATTGEGLFEGLVRVFRFYLYVPCVCYYSLVLLVADYSDRVGSPTMSSRNLKNPRNNQSPPSTAVFAYLTNKSLAIITRQSTTRALSNFGQDIPSRPHEACSAFAPISFLFIRESRQEFTTLSYCYVFSTLCDRWPGLSAFLHFSFLFMLLSNVILTSTLLVMISPLFVGGKTILIDVVSSSSPAENIRI